MRNVTTSLLLSIMLAASALAQSNIDPTNKFGWMENAGWTNWRGEAEPDQGVLVGTTFLSGFIWAENVGWIIVGNGAPSNGVSYANTDGTDFGVNIDYNGIAYDGLSDGSLHGLAWSENVGWINFDGGAFATPGDDARIGCDGRLSGFAWGENIGWMNLSSAEPGKFVAVEPSFVPTPCDLNDDDAVNGLDVQFFVEIVLQSSVPDWRSVCAGDVGAPLNQAVGFEDVGPFANCVLGN
jgi:hypothetical protein